MEKGTLRNLRFIFLLFCLLFGFAFFWSAALFRRFYSFGFQEKKAKQSGGKTPHSKKGKALLFV